MDATGNTNIISALQSEVGGNAISVDDALKFATAFADRQNQVRSSAVFAFRPSQDSIAICFRQATFYLEVHIESPKRPLCKECEIAAERIKIGLKKSKHKPRKLIARLTETDGSETGVEGKEKTFGERLSANLTAFSIVSSVITAGATYFLSRNFAPADVPSAGIAVASVLLLAVFVLVKTILEVCFSGGKFSWKFES